MNMMSDQHRSYAPSDPPRHQARFGIPAGAADAAQRRLTLFLGQVGDLGHHSAASDALLDVDLSLSAA